MSNLYSSADDIRFYNYISPTYYAGVPVAAVDKNIFQFLSEHAFASTDVAVSTNNSTFYKFPKVVGTPTESETATGQTSSGVNARGCFRNTNQDIRCIGSGNTFKFVGMSPLANLNIGTSSTFASVITHKFSTNSLATALDGVTTVILFITKSPSTLMFAECWLGGSAYASMNVSSRFSVAITGWMHDSIFFNTANSISSYYTQVFSTDSTLFYAQNQNRKRLFTTAGNTTIDLEHRYYDIPCSPTNSIILADLILYNRDSPSIQIGKVDNRVACIGRGNLQQGLIYQTTNPFGRTGIEYWLCLGSFTPDEAKWQKSVSDLSLPASLFRTWDINNRDFILMRINLRTDLP